MLEFIVRDKIKPSPMERLLEKKLKGLKIKYYREVEFKECINPRTKCNLRYDFYIPKLKMLIEYDSIKWHEDEDVKYRDIVKNDFAKKNSLNLYRITGYDQIDGLIENLKLDHPIITEVQPLSRKTTNNIPTKKKKKVKKTKIKKKERLKAGKQQLKEITKNLDKQTKASRDRSKNFVPKPLNRIVLV